jgi:hypothetical protein
MRETSTSGRRLTIYSNVALDIPPIDNLGTNIFKDVGKRISGEEVVIAFTISIAANLAYELTKVAIKELISLLHRSIQSRPTAKDADIPKITLIVSRTHIHLEGAFDQDAVLDKILPLLDDRGHSND